MIREPLVDDDVVIVALASIGLLIIGGFTFSYSWLGGFNGSVLVVLGLTSGAGDVALHYLRRGRHAIMYEIMLVLHDNHAYNGGSGMFPTAVQRAVNVPTKRFEMYIGHLVRHNFVGWTPEKKLVLLSKGVAFLGHENLAEFLGEDDAE